MLILYVALAWTPACALGAEPYPDPSEWQTEFFKPGPACGRKARLYNLQLHDWRLRKAGTTSYGRSRTARLWVGKPDTVKAVNREIVAFVTRAERGLKEKGKWKGKWKGYIDSELLMLPYLVRARLEPQTLAAIKRYWSLALKHNPDLHEAKLEGAGDNWGHSCACRTLMAGELTGDANALYRGYWGLRRQLDFVNHSGDQVEYNLHEAHWCGIAPYYEHVKRFSSDPRTRRMARMMAERLWLNRYLVFWAPLGRLTGPGSRNAPNEWLGCDAGRMWLATSMQRPIHLDVFTRLSPHWDPKELRTAAHAMNAFISVMPDLPPYLQDVAWGKAYPHEMQASWNFVDLGPKKYVNYQTEHYTLGSSTQSWIVATCTMDLVAWWLNSRRPADAIVGDPRSFCVLYAHYVFNGSGMMETTEWNKKHGCGVNRWFGWTNLGEFTERGELATLQHKGTVLSQYRPNPIKDLRAIQRASAGMFLYRWEAGTKGLHINDTPVGKLPAELKPGDWWFIEDGSAYAAVRPLQATTLRGNCKIRLEERLHHVVLYVDNLVAPNAQGITSAQWDRCRSGFVVEMGDAVRDGSFAEFRKRIRASHIDESGTNSARRVRYRRKGLDMVMAWDPNEQRRPKTAETWSRRRDRYLERSIHGKPDPWARYLSAPDFVVSDSGRLKTHDATLETREGKSMWLLSCAASKTYVAYQPNCEEQLPLDLACPVGRLRSKRFPFGKVVLRQEKDEVMVEVDGAFQPSFSSPSYEEWVRLGQHLGYLETNLELTTSARKVSASINGDTRKAHKRIRNGKTTWTIKPWDGAQKKKPPVEWPEGASERHVGDPPNAARK